MKKNLSSADRVIRLLLVAVVAVLYFTHQVTGTTAIVLAIAAGVILFTSVVSFCPIYAIFGLSSCKTKAH